MNAATHVLESLGMQDPCHARRYQEELSRSQEEVRRLQVALSGARDNCSSVSEERLQLQQENQQLRREMEELRKTSVQAQRKAKQQVGPRGGARGPTPRSYTQRGPEPPAILPPL